MRNLQKQGPADYARKVLVILLSIPVVAFVLTEARPQEANRITPEMRTARALDAARGNPLELRAFLSRMPKGADLHSHLTGAVYAESWIRTAAEDNLCVDLSRLSFVKLAAPSPTAPSERECGEGKVPVSKAYTDQRLYDSLVDAFSMRGFVPSSGVTGHDHFFNAFAKFSGTDRRHMGEWLDEVAARAAAQNEQYLELMIPSSFTHTSSVIKELGWNDNLDQLRTDLLARGLRDDIAAIRAELDQAEATRQSLKPCDQQDLQDQFRACRVQIQYIYQVLRGLPKELVFAQTLLGFEIASTDSRVVGINFVQPEDGYTAMSDYALQMRMVGFLHERYPKVHISLHAGELAPGLVPPDGLRRHIRLAVEQGHAERIGHGADIMYETNPYELMSDMARKHVLVEINLTSNDIILGMSGKDHPLPIYRKLGVPVALSTDDEGVSRIDLTHEYVRAVGSYDLNYADLKQMVRASIEHSFLPGTSLWRDPDVFTGSIPQCASDPLGASKTSPSCAAFLKSSQKAAQQWELEVRFRVFESSF